MDRAERPRAEAPTTPHTFLWVVSFAGIGLEVLLFAALGQRWPPLQPGPLSPLAATTVATLAAIVWSYGSGEERVYADPIRLRAPWLA